VRRFKCRPRPRTATSSARATGTPTAARPGARWHARRHRTCAMAVVKPRSTPQRACFITSLDVTKTSVAGEVTLYLALPSPSSPAAAFLGLVPGPSSFHRRTHVGPPPAHLKARSRSTNEHSVWTGSSYRMIAPPSSSRSAQPTRRGPADEPSRVLLPRLTTTSRRECGMASDVVEGRLPRSRRAHLGTRRPSYLSCPTASSSPPRLRFPTNRAEPGE